MVMRKVNLHFIHLQNNLPYYSLALTRTHVCACMRDRARAHTRTHTLDKDCFGGHVINSIHYIMYSEESF